MSITSTSRVSALVLTLGLAFPIAGFAQDTPPAVQAPAAAANPAGRAQHLTQEQMMQRVETHLSGLRTQLGITPAQEPQWHDFAKVTRDNAVAIRQRFAERSTRLAQMTAPDNMLNFAQLSEQHAQEQLRLATAFRGLYDVMSTEQKQRADTIFRTPRQHHQQRRAGGPAQR